MDAGIACRATSGLPEWKKFEIGMEAGRRDIVKTQLVVYRLLRSAGRDPLWQRAKRIGKVSLAEDPYYVVASQLESQFQISGTELGHWRLMAMPQKYNSQKL